MPALLSIESDVGPGGMKPRINPQSRTAAIFNFSNSFHAGRQTNSQQPHI